MKKSIFKPVISLDWLEIFESIPKKILIQTEEEYKKIKDTPDVFPVYEKIFNFTYPCKFSEIKVLICGQDPYHQTFYDPVGKKNIPQATGMAFDVPKNCPIPPSLVNIYDNLQRFTHIDKKPCSGNLINWCNQGVLLLNTSLTVEKSKPNSHQKIWSQFTDELLQIISEKHPGLIIVMWGSHAFGKMKYIKSQEKHHFIISSHPSPLGYKTKMKGYESFYETDHFGKINEILRSKGEKEINWKIDS
jgi:uracil-DNA glycosylase